MTSQTTTQLIGRRAEMDALLSVIDAVETRGRALLVRGDPGVGKTSVVHATIEAAKDAGRFVLETAGIETEAALPYAGLHYLLAPLLGSIGALPMVQQQAVLTAFGLAEGPPPELFLVALATLNLMTDQAASRPVVVVIDDMQWLDLPTNEVMAFVARRISEDPVVIIGVLREGHTIAFSSAHPDEIEIRGLNEASSREVLSRTATDLSLRDRETILDQARGNPLALTELPAAWRSAGPSKVTAIAAVLPLSGRLERTFATRVTELPAITRDALLIAAINSEGSLAEVLAAASVLSGAPVAASVLESAERVGILRFDETHIEFRHPLVRSGILQNESVSRRQSANAAMGHVLYDQPYRRAWHRAHAVYGPDDTVADELYDSHFECIARGAIMAAISALERAAQLSNDSNVRGRRLLLAAQHAFGLGRADLVDHLITAAERNDLSGPGPGSRRVSARDLQ